MGGMSESLLVNEIFYSIQGESTRAGLPCVFVRLTGCHLRCRWCDTEYAFNEGRRMTIGRVVEMVREFRCRLVEVTGGEPLLQPGSLGLMGKLADAGLTVMLETSGACDIGPVDPRVIRVVDIKCPGSGESERNRWTNIDLLTERDEVKFVLADRADYEWAVDVVKRYRLVGRCPILFSPVHGGQVLEDLAGWILSDRVPVRMQIQLHKLIWPGVARGV